VEETIKDIIPRMRRFGKKLIANIAAETPEEFGILVRLLSEAGIAIFQANVSCPNLDKKLIGFLPEEVSEVIYEMYSAAPEAFHIVKVPPIIGGGLCLEVVLAAKQGGANAVLVSNTLPGLAFDSFTRQPMVANRVFGMSGAPLKPVALKIINDLYKANIGLPIIGSGGIMNGKDAMEFFLAGASAVEIGIGDFMDANAALKIRQELIDWVNFHKAGNIMNLIGKGA